MADTQLTVKNLNDGATKAISDAFARLALASEEAAQSFTLALANIQRSFDPEELRRYFGLIHTGMPAEQALSVVFDNKGSVGHTFSRRSLRP